MENNSRRIVACEECKTKFAFMVPGKPGIYRISCPKCQKAINFRVVNK